MSANVPPKNRSLRERPDLDQLKRQAKELLDAFRAGEGDAVAEVTAWYRGANAETFALHEAQLVIARSYGFTSWPKLKAHVDGVTLHRAADAVRAADVAEVNAMLERRPELVHIDMAEHDEHRLLHYAVLARNPEMVRLLMQYGADARKGIYPHREATTALTIASDRGYDEIVAIIHEGESNRRATRPESPGHTTPTADAMQASALEPPTGRLTLAVKHNRMDTLRQLLSLGLDPNERTRLEDVEGAVYSAGAPLHYCASNGKLEMATVLLDAGADPNVQVYAAGSAMHRACTSGDAAMIELLMRHGGVPDAITVSSLGQIDAARRMLDDEAAGSLPKAAVCGMMGGTAVAEDLLWGGSGAGSVEVVRMALERVDWPRTDMRWYNVLREPMYIGMNRPTAEREALIECFRLMLVRFDPASRGNAERGWFGGRTLLHDLASPRHAMPAEDQLTIATLLLDAGARLDVRDDLLKSTPLGWASRWGRVELVRLLLSRGADPIESDAEPWATPRAWAASRGHDDVLRVLDGE